MWEEGRKEKGVREGRKEGRMEKREEGRGKAGRQADRFSGCTPGLCTQSVTGGLSNLFQQALQVSPNNKV